MADSNAAVVRDHSAAERANGRTNGFKPQPSPKIFVIGFNKCGTTSFHRLFVASGIKSMHFGSKDVDKNAALKLHRNFTLCRDILSGLEEYTSFTDLTYCHDLVFIEGIRLYREFHREYPDAYFILNIRPVENWLRSRFNHGTMAQRSCSSFRCSREELKELWRDQFHKHNEEVERYFANAGGRFLRFDIESDPPERIREFLAPDFDIQIDAWGSENRTNKRDNLKRFRQSLSRTILGR